MRALSVHQPYADMFFDDRDQKRVENRGWATNFRGPLAIHASKSKMRFKETRSPVPQCMAFGAIVGVVHMIDCVFLDLEQVRHKYPWMVTHTHSFGPYCFVFENPVRLPNPIPWRGHQSFFFVPDHVFPNLVFNETQNGKLG